MKRLVTRSLAEAQRAGERFAFIQAAALLGFCIRTCRGGAEEASAAAVRTRREHFGADMTIRVIWLRLDVNIGLACWAGAAGPHEADIVFILADDLGWRDTATYGSTYYETLTSTVSRAGEIHEIPINWPELPADAGGAAERAVMVRAHCVSNRRLRSIVSTGDAQPAAGG